MSRKAARRILIFVLALTVFFIIYGWFFRTYLDGEKYLNIAYEYTGRDPTIIDWRQPEFSLEKLNGRIAVRLVFHTTDEAERGPIGLYIDPLRQAVIATDPRR